MGSRLNWWGKFLRDIPKNIFGLKVGKPIVFQVETDPKQISLQQYVTQIGGIDTSISVKSDQNNIDENCEKEKAKRLRAFEFAVDARKMEIELYWKRASYFWAFIIAILTFYALLMRLENPPGELLYASTCMGIIFSLAWHLTNMGSKSWQRHWETHIDLLEDEFMGPIYKTVTTQLTYSVSKINLIVSFAVVVFWIFSNVYTLHTLNLINLNSKSVEFTYLLMAIGTILVAVSMQFGMGRGRFKEREIKVYRRSTKVLNP